MRLVVTAVILSGIPYAMAQTSTPVRPIQSPAVGQRPRIRQAGNTNPALAGNAKAATVPPNTPVITLEGLCIERPAKGSCKTVITREELDRFVSAFSPNASESVRSRMAVQYARSLAFSVLAEQRGFDKNPVLAKEMAAQLRLIRMRILASAFMQALQEQAPASADADVQKYYEANRDQYEQARVRRMSVPMEVPNETGRPLDRSKVKSAMEEIRNRAVAGEDFNQLLQELYKEFHIQATPPPIDVMAVERRNLQGDEAKAFDLKPGEVSAVLDLPASVAIIKLESKEPMPLTAVRPEIEAWLRGTRAQTQLRQFSDTIKPQFDLQYFDLPSQPDLFGVGATTPAVAQAKPRRAPVTSPGKN